VEAVDSIKDRGVYYVESDMEICSLWGMPLICRNLNELIDTNFFRLKTSINFFKPYTPLFTIPVSICLDTCGGFDSAWRQYLNIYL
jgi:hypothetical protein